MMQFPKLSWKGGLEKLRDPCMGAPSKVRFFVKKNNTIVHKSIKDYHIASMKFIFMDSMPLL